MGLIAWEGFCIYVNVYCICVLLCRTLFPAEVQEELTDRLLDMADIHSDSRSFALSIEDFSRLCLAYQKLCDEHQGLRDYDFRYNKIELPSSSSIDDISDDY